uniref:Uncharacterized protein n=1 Tax=Brassica oleracea var. oleracea TaxID=109376 RepID=A0A0D3CM09_BRAOL
MLGELMSTLDKMPDEPQDYKPPFFWGCLENEAQYLLAKNPLRVVEVGNVNSKRLVLTLKPQDYKPPFFWGCLENEAQYLLAKNPLRVVEVGNVNSKRLVLTL